MRLAAPKWKRRTSSLVGVTVGGIVIVVVFLIAIGHHHSSKNVSAAVGGVVVGGSGRHNNGADDAAAYDPDDVLALIHQVQGHLQSVRNRMQDRPGAPQVTSQRGLHLNVRDHYMPMHLASEADEDMHSTIFISMAAFRDVECGPTLEDLFAKAKYPHRIFVGIVDQREANEQHLCMPPSFIACQHQVLNDTIVNSTRSSFCPMDNVRFRRTLPIEARGPTFGRFVAQLMYQGEAFFMMIDSHNRFVEKWDTRLLRMYQQLPTKGVISHYPSGYEPGFVLESNHDIMFMCYAHYYDGVGILRNGAKNVRNRQKRPVLQPFTAAGFLFGAADYVFDVPFDPYLDYLFDGEEILYTVRLWTAGWDSYLPSHDIMYHFYGRPKAPKVWGTTNQWVAIQQASQRRVLHLLKMTKPNTTIPIVDPAVETDPRILKEIDKYGLGTDRRVEDFWPFAHVDPIKRQSDRGFCDRAN